MTDLARKLIEKERKEQTGVLDLGNCGLDHIPAKLFQLTWLRELSFADKVWDPEKGDYIRSPNPGRPNQWTIEELPTGLKRLTQLKKLRLNTGFNFGSSLKSCDILRHLRQLELLSLGCNQIRDIGFLEELTALQSLDLHHNQISDISALEKLTALQSLNLRHNQISDIRPLLPLLKAKRQMGMDLKWLGFSFGENPIRTPPINIVEKGAEAIIAWFEQMEEQGEGPLFEAKLMILGQGGVGKTAFATLQFDPDYEVKPGKISSTLSITIHRGKEFGHQHIGDQKIKAHLWDFGGQDLQKMLHQFFITENALYMLLSDQRKENTNFNYWFQIINLLGPQSSVIVLENPIDIASATQSFPLNIYRMRFEVLDIERSQVNLAQTRDRHQERWRGLGELIAEKLSRLEIVNRPVPAKWCLVRDELERARKKKYISKDDFYQICSRPEIALSPEHADLRLSYLRDLGDLAYFDDITLCDRIFLDHNWLIQGMYYILSDDSIKKRGGTFTRKQAFAQWDRKRAEKGETPYTAVEKIMLLRLLLKDGFDICYEIPGNGETFITPLLLPDDMPETWRLPTNLRFRYHYKFMPHGMFSRLIVQMHEKIDGERRWKSGMFLKHEPHDSGRPVQALVQQMHHPDSNQHIIDIQISGEKEAAKSC